MPPNKPSGDLSSLTKQQLRERLDQLEQRYEQEVKFRTETQSLLEAVVKATAGHTGDEFFGSLAKVLATTFGVEYVLVCQHLGDPISRARTCAFWARGELKDNIEYPLEGGPCELTAAGEWTFVPDGVQGKFPLDRRP